MSAYAGEAETVADRGESSAADPPKLFHELDRKGKLVRVIAVAYALIHIGATLVGGAIPPIKRIFTPVLGFYSDGLRMSNAWGMFGKPPTSTHVSIEAVLPNGKAFVISTTDPHTRPFVERIADARVRKIEGKLAEDGDRARIGAPFLDYYCRVAERQLGPVREMRIRNILHEMRDDEGNITRAASSVIVLSRRCDQKNAPVPRPTIPPVARPQGGDM
jgi:hypothetical protein